MFNINLKYAQPKNIKVLGGKMNSEYGFKLENLVNNLSNGKVLNEQINQTRHTISKTNYCESSINFYGENGRWLIELAEENVDTIADLNNYIGWICDE